AAAYAGQLHDGFYSYARGLSASLRQDPDAFRNGTQLLRNMEMTFEGMSGLVRMSDVGIRMPSFYIDSLDGDGVQELYGTVFVNGSYANYIPVYTNEAELWWSRGGLRPLAQPVCGFSGKQ
ncbi:hypothetical protein OSTOST_01264, partial [Ostertagia ostertagi]